MNKIKKVEALIFGAYVSVQVLCTNTGLFYADFSQEVVDVCHYARCYHDTMSMCEAHIQEVAETTNKEPIIH